MAYDASITGAYASKTAYGLYMYCRRDQVDPPSNRSSYAWALDQISWSDYDSYNLTAYTWYTTVGSESWSGSVNLDFRGVHTGAHRGVSSGSTGWITHNAEGYLDVNFACSHVTSPWGTAQASGWLYTDRIASTPAPPGAVVWSMITPTTVRAYVPGSPNGNGSPVDEYLLRISQNANPEVMPFTDYFPNMNTGIMDVIGLTPGVTYYGKAYAHNAMGYTAGVITSFTTLSGAYIGKDDFFQGAEVLVGKDGAYVTASIYIGKDGSYVLAT